MPASTALWQQALSRRSDEMGNGRDEMKIQEAIHDYRLAVAESRRHVDDLMSHVMP